MKWTEVQRELQLLEATAPKSKAWYPQALQMTEAMRLAAKLRAWAPSMLQLKEVLSTLFKSSGDDECSRELQEVVKSHENLWERQLDACIALVQPFRKTIETLSPGMQDYTIKLVEFDKGQCQALLHVLSHPSVDKFNSLMSLVKPNTDDAIVLNSLACLGSTRTFLAKTLFTVPPYSDLRSFIAQLATLTPDDQVFNSLDSIQVNYDPLVKLLTSQSRSPSIQACYDLIALGTSGEYRILCSTDPEAQIKCHAEKTWKYEALADLRRQLLMTDIPEEGLDTGTEKYSREYLHGLMEDFVKKFMLMEACGKCSLDLLDLGHFAYEKEQEVLVVKSDMSVKALEKFKDALEKKLEDWTSAVEAARAAHYFLNYYTVCELRQLVKKVPLCAQNDEWAEIMPLFQVVDPDLEGVKFRERVKKSPQLKKCDESVEEVARLTALGEMLTELFKPLQPRQRLLQDLHMTAKEGQRDLGFVGLQDKEKGVPVFVCCADRPSKVTELILSIYTRRQRVPEAEELLMCSGNTTLEQVELLLWRFFSAKLQGRENRLYCVGNVHLLTYNVQCGAVEFLRRMEIKHGGYDKASAVVFVSGLDNQMLTNALHERKEHIGVLPPACLREAVQRVGEQYHRRPIEAVAAKLNGAGKSHYILKQMAQHQTEFGDQPIRQHVDIRETTDIQSLVESLLNDPTDAGIPTAVHIDLAHILPTYVDTLLFEVLIVGMLRDPSNAKVYHRRQTDFFYVEIPNTPEENTAKQLSFCLLLPRTYLTMSADRYEYEWPSLEEQVSWVAESGAHCPIRSRLSSQRMKS
jgi:hypothetical protein